MVEYPFIPLPGYEEFPQEEMQQRSQEFYQQMNRRRTVRDFSDRTFPRSILEDCLRTAGTAPSGANLQPWQFVLVESPEVKREIRLAAEEEERTFYETLAPPEWLEALAPLGTDSDKPFLETAPYLVAIFAEKHGLTAGGEVVKHYYASESVGIATGMLITAIHQAGLVSLTHTPAPMKFLNRILNRPDHERPYLLLAVGYPADDARVPDISASLWKTSARSSDDGNA